MHLKSSFAKMAAILSRSGVGVVELLTPTAMFKAYVQKSLIWQP